MEDRIWLKLMKNQQLSLLDYQSEQNSHGVRESTHACVSFVQGHAQNLGKPYRNALNQLLPWEEENES